MTYKKLLALDMEQFNERKNKTIQEYLLYLYHQYGTEDGDAYQFDFNEICKAFFDELQLIDSISLAFCDLIIEYKGYGCESTIRELSKKFLDDNDKLASPIAYLDNHDKCENCIKECIDHYIWAFSVLEDFNYDLKKLLKPNKYNFLKYKYLEHKYFG